MSRDLVIVTKGTLIERDLDLLSGYEKVARQRLGAVTG